MKLSLDEPNNIIYKVIKNNCTSAFQIMKSIDEFGYYKYFINSRANERNEIEYIDFSFYYTDFQKIFNFSGKEWIETALKGNEIYIEFPYRLDEKVLDFSYSIVFSIDIRKYIPCFAKLPKSMPEEEKAKILLELEPLRHEMEKYAENVASLFARFRVDFMASAFKKYLREIKEKHISEAMAFNLNVDNRIYLIPTPECLSVLYGMHFEQKTDKSLAIIFFRELEDAKFQVSNTIPCRYYQDCGNPPDLIKKIESNPRAFSSGFLQFGILVLRRLVPKGL